MQDEAVVKMDALLNGFIKNNLALKQVDISAVAKSREWFLNRISNVIASRQGEPALYHEEPFVYFGSYFKGTKVSSLDEYDVLVVVDSNTGQFSTGGSVLGNGLGQAYPNNKYLKKYYKSDESGVSPSKLLNWLKGVVQEVVDSFSGQTPIRSGQAVTAEIASKNLKIDLVPAGIFSHISTEQIFYNIPKGDQGNNWIITNPKEDKKLLNSYAQNRFQFKNAIRILKYIKGSYNFLIPSFALECFTIRYAMYHYWNDSIFINLYNMLMYLSQNLREGVILDTYDNSTNLIENVDSRFWYADRIDGITGAIQKALLEEDHNKAYQYIYSSFSNT